MRKSFDGLCGLVRDELKRDPLSGEVFIFISRRRNTMKLLHWEEGGFVLYYKRLKSERISIIFRRRPGAAKLYGWQELRPGFSGCFVPMKIICESLGSGFWVNCQTPEFL